LLASAGCAGDGHFCLLGYSTKPNYDTRFRTVSVPMVKNRSAYVVTPVVGLEQDLHRALVDQIQVVTPYRVAQADPDTELSVTIRSVTKNLLNFTPFNAVREAELVVTVDLVWRDLRSGEVLSRPSRRPGQAADADAPQPLLNEGLLPREARPVGDVPARRDGAGQAAGADEEVPVDPRTRRAVVPITVRTSAHYREELGESTTTALQQAIKKIARQITAAMEPGW
ncbi:MAG: LPS assembly lipoprotein LptE, partial [Gemmataceae bacterium]